MSVPLYFAADALERIAGAIDARHVAAAVVAFAVWQTARWLRR